MACLFALPSGACSDFRLPRMVSNSSMSGNPPALSREIEDGVLADESFLDIVDFGVQVRATALLRLLLSLLAASRMMQQTRISVVA